MNVPLNAMGGLRDPFAAFVCDEDTAEILRPIATEMGWPTERVAKGGLRSAAQALSVSASPSILFVDLSESSDQLSDIGALAEVCEPGTIVLATGHLNDVRLYRELINSGIQDYLLKPLVAEQVREAILQAQALLSGPRSIETVAHPHVMTAVIGARGGAGASTVATSLAWLLSDSKGRATALFDLDIHFGTAALALDLEPGRGLTDAIENPARIDTLFIERAMVKASDRLSVLSAEAPLNHPMTGDAAAMLQLEEEMKQAFECTVLDLPRGVMIQHPHLLYDAQQVVLVTELTLAATRDTIRILSFLKANAPQARVVLVANKVPAGTAGEIGRRDFEGSVEREVDIVLPYDAKLAVQAAKLGKPLVEVARGTRLGQALADLSDRLISGIGDGDETGRGSRGKSLLGRLGDLRSLLPSKGGR